MRPICIQKFIKRKVRHDLRYKPSDLYTMYLEKADKFEIIHKVTVERIKPTTLRRSMLGWDWIERRGKGSEAYYVRIDEPSRVEFSDIYEAVMRKYRSLRWKW